MEVWNREELYSEIWEQPLVKLAAKYGISAVMLGKVCRKLQVPLPGRGYWAKKEFGKAVGRLPLPKAKDLPIVQRFKLSSAEVTAPTEKGAPEPEPTDPEYLRIKEIESRPIGINPDAKTHKLVTMTAKSLRRGRVDTRGMLEGHWQHPHLDVRVSPATLDRALAIANAVILTLEVEEFPVSLQSGKHATIAEIFGHKVALCHCREVPREEPAQGAGTKLDKDRNRIRADRRPRIPGSVRTGGEGKSSVTQKSSGWKDCCRSSLER